MKKYRCPHCGEECITLGNKISCYSQSAIKRPRINTAGNYCPECSGIFMILEENTFKSNVKFLIIVLALLFVLYLVFAVNAYFILLLLLAYFLLPSIIMPLTSIYLPIVQYDRKKSEHIIPESNARFIIEGNVKGIGNLDIYGIKFRQETRNVRFHEAFTNDLVPVVFHKKSKKQQGELEVTIMKIKFIPDELLSEGAEFTVIDNGKEIAKGRIVKLLPEI